MLIGGFLLLAIMIILAVLSVPSAPAGLLIPLFFISGLRFNLQALFESPGALVLAPVFQIALLIVRSIASVTRLAPGKRMSPQM